MNYLLNRLPLWLVHALPLRYRWRGSSQSFNVENGVVLDKGPKFYFVRTRWMWFGHYLHSKDTSVTIEQYENWPN